MKLYNMLGYKLYKENEDGTIHMIRIIGMKRPSIVTENTQEPSEITIYDYDTEEKSTVRVDTLKEYSPIKPDGILTLSIVNIKDKNDRIFKDVIVTASKFLNIEFKLNVMPYAVCRQNITDIFYNLICNKDNNDMVGLSVNQDTCPTNFDFGLMFAANELLHNDFINFYRTDVITDLLDTLKIKISKYDDVLRSLYEVHIKTVHRPELNFRNNDSGWCRDLKELLKENNFQEDVNQMLGITDVKFDITPYIITKKMPNSDNEYEIASDDLRYWLSSIYKVSMKEIGIIKFDHDINLADFNNNRYMLIRDINKVLYLMVYTLDGEYHEADLEAKAKEMDFSTKFKIEFYNKYNKINNLDINN